MEMLANLETIVNLVKLLWNYCEPWNYLTVRKW